MDMSSWSKPTYHRRLFWGLVTYSWLLVAAFAVFQYHREKRFKAEEFNQRLQTVNEEIIEAAGDNFSPTDLAWLDKTKFKDLRVTIIDHDGSVVFDNSVDSLPGTNHLRRAEIAQALNNGSGYTTRRHSESTGDTYFYAATNSRHYIVRTAVPYSVTLNDILGPDFGFLWIMSAITLAMCVVGYFATRRVGLHVSRLNRFAERAEKGERIYDTEPFPHDELGEISNHIVRLYARLQQAVADRDKEHELALKQEQEKIRIKRQLTNNINHELRTPVSSMRICLETIINHPEIDPAKRDEFIARSFANCQRLNRLLDDVATITRLDEGSESITKAPVDLAKIIAESVDDNNEAARLKGIEINNLIASPLPMTGNQSMLSSIFNNLIANSIAYSGGSTIRIEAVDADDDLIVVTLQDDGIGVGQEHLPRLFERFYRVDKGRSRQAGGTGLGLAIVKNAVIFHGGQISVANLRGGGLIFKFSLKR